MIRCIVHSLDWPESDNEFREFREPTATNFSVCTQALNLTFVLPFCVPFHVPAFWVSQSPIMNMPAYKLNSTSLKLLQGGVQAVAKTGFTYAPWALHFNVNTMQVSWGSLHTWSRNWSWTCQQFYRSSAQHSSIRTWLAVLYVDRAFCTTFTSPVKRQELFAMTRTCVDVPTLIFGGS